LAFQKFSWNDSAVCADPVSDVEEEIEGWNGKGKRQEKEAGKELIL